MPVSAVTSTLTDELVPLFEVETAPSTTDEAASMWAEAYARYLTAGGVPIPPFRRRTLASTLTAAFQPTLAGAGLPLFLQALTLFWLPGPPFPIPGQGPTAVSAGFFPLNPVLTTTLPPKPSVRQQAGALATIIASLTLQSVKVLIPPATAPVPLL